MLTLDQVRVVNDSHKKGDLSAALKPLEEQIDLRHAELPRLDKAAIAALKKGLEEPNNARIWAEAAFHPNISVRRFARKTLLGLRSEAAPIAPFLQARLEQFWNEETPLPWASTAREAAARRDQMDRVQNAIDILLRADPDLFMTFWARLSDAAQPAKALQQKENEEWRSRQAAYSEAYRRHSEAIIREELGEEYVTKGFYMAAHNLPSRLWGEIYQRVQEIPEVKRLQEKLGENSWALAAQQWQPPQLFNAALQSYLQPNASGPQREVAAQARVHFWKWLDEAFDNHATPEQRSLAVSRLLDNIHFYWSGNILGYEQIWERLPKLLQETRPSLLKAIVAAFKPTTYAGRANAGALWSSLAQALAQASRRPYNVKEDDWHVPDHITPELLRSFKIAEQNEYGINYQLEESAKALEKERKKKAPAVVAAPAPAVEQPTAEVDLNAIAFSYGDVNWDAITAESMRTGEDWTAVYERSKTGFISEAEAGPQLLDDIDDKVAKILDPPKGQGALNIRRFPYWQLWNRKFGREMLMEKLWPILGPKLWERYEAKLTDYRRVETAEIAPKLGEKLTANEIKEWKSSQRRLKRTHIENELRDIANVLREAEGFEADIKQLQFLERPGFKELLTRQYNELLAQLASTGHHSTQTRTKGHEIEWLRQNWCLDTKWVPLLEKIENYLLSNKRAQPWERQNALRLLAIANYRLQTPQGLAHFRELAAQVDSMGYELIIPVTTLGDVETWLLLISKLDYANPDLALLWQDTQQNQSPNASHLTAKVLETLGALSNERAAKFIIGLFDHLPPAELTLHGEAILSLLESPLVLVKRWALATIPKVPDLEYDSEATARLVGEMLWSEGALPKDAAKFLGGQASQFYPSTAWDELCGATSLENITLLETIFRSLTQIRAKHPELTLDDTAKERLEALVAAQADRFNKFAKKLI